MIGDGARPGDGSDPLERLRGRVTRLSELRLEGLRLVSDGDAEKIAAWHRLWASLLNQIRAQLDFEAPRQAGLVLWPAVNAQPLNEIQAELVRAAVGCRELALLVGELGDARDNAENPDVLVSAEDAHQGAIYVRAGHQFEGAIRLRRIIEPARESLVVVDRYMDDDTFTLAAAPSNGISRRFLTLNHRHLKPRVIDAWAHWGARWEGDSECRTGSELPHLRLLVVDGAPYHIDSSLKDFGSSLTCFRMLPTDEWEIIRGDVESAWRRATPL